MVVILISLNIVWDFSELLFSNALYLLLLVAAVAVFSLFSGCTFLLLLVPAFLISYFWRFSLHVVNDFKFLFSYRLTFPYNYSVSFLTSPLCFLNVQYKLPPLFLCTTFPLTFIQHCGRVCHGLWLLIRSHFSYIGRKTKGANLTWS